jgi:hypothetical protein
MPQTVLTEDGLRHIVKRIMNGWHYFFECGSDDGYETNARATDDAATCLSCIEKHRECQSS